MARQAGRVAVLQIQSDGVDGSAGWDTVAVKRDLSITDTREEIDISASELYDVFISGPGEFVIEGEIVRDEADTEYAALDTAYRAGTSLGFRAIEDASGSGKGIEFDGVVTRFDVGAARRDGQMTSIRIRPATGGTQPTKFTEGA
jgi:hypothetical protein